MKKYLILVIVIVLLLSLFLAFYIFNKEENIENENNLLTEQEALVLGKDKYEKINTYIINILSIEKDNYVTESDIKFYYYENLETEFNKLFSKKINLNNLFLEYDTNNLSDSATNLTYIKKNNSYYVDNVCRSGGANNTFDNLKVVNITDNIINYTYDIKSLFDSCVEDCDKTFNKEMQLIKENDEWKINKISIPNKCGFLTDINY